jgi:hypothetical protein
MVRKNLDLSDAEKAEADRCKALLGLTDREAYLRGLGIEAPERKMGRPRKRSLRFLGVLRDDENESFKNQVCRP